MHIDRLEHATRIMEWVRDEEKPLDLRYWFYDRNSRDCGTAACFWGWCARNKSFQKLGVTIVGDSVKYLDHWGSRAAAEFFGIEHEAAQYLVLPECYEGKGLNDITPDDVISHIRAVIANDGRAPGEGV
jgi:hypothetical protein